MRTIKNLAKEDYLSENTVCTEVVNAFTRIHMRTIKTLPKRIQSTVFIFLSNFEKNSVFEGCFNMSLKFNICAFGIFVIKYIMQREIITKNKIINFF